MSPFSADIVRRLGGPPWLAERRSAAFERFGTTALPTTEEEVWRYSRIPELDLDDHGPVEPGAALATGGVPEGVAPLVEAVGQPAAVVVVRNGTVSHVEVDDGAARAGLRVGSLATLDGGDGQAGGALGSVAGRAKDAFGLLHDAFVADPVLVEVPAGVALSAPVVVLHWTDLDGVATFPRLVVRAGGGSDVTVCDHQASADVAALVVPVVELDAGPAAQLRYLNVQTLGQRVWQLGRQASRVGRDATFSTTMVALGGDYARLSIDSTMVGKGGSGNMLALYFGERSQMHDFRTLQDHLAPTTTSNLLFKGAVQGRARSVYTGLIHIGKEAPRVDAFQTNRNIKLSAGAWAESVPNLEIENNDVRCSHASAVGPVDEDQRFYLESRGVPPKVAERLIVTGFFEEVLERLPVPGVAAPLRAEIAAKLGRREEQDGG